MSAFHDLSLALEALSAAEVAFTDLGKLFEDADFITGEHLLGPSDPKEINADIIESPIVWLRPFEFCGFESSSADQLKLTLFSSELSPSDIIQGHLGDCYVVAALMLLASVGSDLVHSLFVNTTYSTCGLYICRFALDGNRCYVVVDDHIPCKQIIYCDTDEHGIDIETTEFKPIFAHCRNKNELWVCIVEKALAKLYGSYNALRGGNMSEALVDLSGCPVEDLNFDRPEVEAAIQSGELFTSLLSHCHHTNFTDRVLLGTASCVPPGQEITSEANHGICQNHAYAILDVLDLSLPATTTTAMTGGKGKSPKQSSSTRQRVVKLRNSFKQFEWKGKFSREDCLQHNNKNSIYTQLDYSQMAYGEFYMDWTDYIKYFNRLYICKLGLSIQQENSSLLTGAWSVANQTAGGCSNYASSWYHNHVFYVTMPTAVKSSRQRIVVQLQQPDLRFTSREKGVSMDYQQIGLTLIKVPSSYIDSPFLPPIIAESEYLIHRTAFWNKRDVSLDCELPLTTTTTTLDGSSFALIPSTYFPNQENTFKMRIWSSQQGEGGLLIKQRWDATNGISDWKQHSLLGEWKGISAAGRLKPGNQFHFNPTYHLLLPAPLLPDTSSAVTVHISLTLLDQTAPLQHGMGIYILRDLPQLTADISQEHPVGKFDFTNLMEVYRHNVTLERGVHYLFVCSTFDAKVLSKFRLTVYCKEDLDLQDVTLTRASAAAAEAKEGGVKFPPIVSPREGNNSDQQSKGKNKDKKKNKSGSTAQSMQTAKKGMSTLQNLYADLA